MQKVWVLTSCTLPPVAGWIFISSRIFWATSGASSRMIVVRSSFDSDSDCSIVHKAAIPTITVQHLADFAFPDFFTTLAMLWLASRRPNLIKSSVLYCSVCNFAHLTISLMSGVTSSGTRHNPSSSSVGRSAILLRSSPLPLACTDGSVSTSFRMFFCCLEDGLVRSDGFKYYLSCHFVFTIRGHFIIENSINWLALRWMTK